MTAVTGPERDYSPSEQRRDAWLVLTFSVACLAVIAAVVSIGFSARVHDDAKNATNTSATGGTSAPASVMVDLSEFKIDPAEVTVAEGGSVQVMNQGTTAHNLAIKDSDLKTADIAAGGEESLKLSGLKTGDYTMFCAIPGHEAAGMTGTIHVVAAGSGSSSGGSSGGTATKTMSNDEMDAMMSASLKAFPAKTDGLGGQVLAPKVLSDGTKEFDLVAKTVKWEVEPGKFVEAQTYNGVVPGPTLKVNPGDKVRVVIKNEMKESTAIHFHGLMTPNSMDGVPGVTQDPIKPGDTFTYRWTAQSTPAVGMYHSHQFAVHQVPNGMAGAFLIGDMPLPDGVTVSQQVPMMLNDSGTIGFAINGKSFPATAPIIAKQGDWIEINYLNEGGAIHPMHLHGMPQLVIAKDGFPVTPYEADTIAVAPGERYTVLVHATEPGVWVWHCHILSHAENDTAMFGMVTALIVK